MSTDTDALDPDRHLQEDLLETPLPTGWTLHETAEDKYYARHPEAGQTPDREDPEAVSDDAHRRHREWSEGGTADDTQGTDDTETAPKEEAASTSEASPGDESLDTQHEIPDTDLPAPTEVPDVEPPDPVPEVYDEEKERFVEVGEPDREYARTLHQWVEVGTLVTGLALKAIRDNEAYTALGCSSFKEYCETMAPMGQTTAYRHINRAETYEPFLPDFDPEVVPNWDNAPLKRLLSGTSSNEDEDDVMIGGDGEAEEGAPESPVPTALQGLGGSKLDALGDLPEDRLEEYVEHEELRTPEGGTITLDEIREMTAKKVTRRVGEILEPHKEKAEAEKEKRLKAEAERDALEKKLQEKKEEIERARDLEETLGPKAARLEEKRRRMEKMEKALREASKQIYKIGLTTEDPIPDQERAMDLMAHAERLADACREELADVLLNPELSGDL